MATDGVILVRERIVAVKTEATTGTAIALAAADGPFNAFDQKMDYQIPPTERQTQGSMTPLTAIPGARMGKHTFKTRLFNASTAPKEFSVLLLSCGFQVATGVYTPLTGSQVTSTQGMYQGATARFKSLAGCMGNFKLSGEKGAAAIWDWDFMGKTVPPAAATKIVPTYPTVQPPRVAGITLSIGGATVYRAGKFELDMGNKVIMREDVQDVTGYHAAYITDRKPVIKIPIESLDLSVHDFYADHLVGTTMAISIVIGSGTNGTITIAAPAAQLLNPPQDEERDGINLDSLEFLCTNTTQDTELSITLS